MYLLSIQRYRLCPCFYRKMECCWNLWTTQTVQSTHLKCCHRQPSMLPTTYLISRSVQKTAWPITQSPWSLNLPLSWLMFFIHVILLMTCCCPWLLQVVISLRYQRTMLSLQAVDVCKNVFPLAYSCHFVDIFWTFFSYYIEVSINVTRNSILMLSGIVCYVALPFKQPKWSRQWSMAKYSKHRPEFQYAESYMMNAFMTF